MLFDLFTISELTGTCAGTIGGQARRSTWFPSAGHAMLWVVEEQRLSGLGGGQGGFRRG